MRKANLARIRNAHPRGPEGKVAGERPELVIDGKDEDFHIRGDDIALDGRSMQCQLNVPVLDGLRTTEQAN